MGQPINKSGVVAEKYENAKTAVTLFCYHFLWEACTHLHRERDLPTEREVTISFFQINLQITADTVRNY